MECNNRVTALSLPDHVSTTVAATAAMTSTANMTMTITTTNLAATMSHNTITVTIANTIEITRTGFSIIE